MQCCGGCRVDCQVTFPKWTIQQMVKGEQFSEGLAGL